jgi:hypothetical protein
MGDGHEDDTALARLLPVKLEVETACGLILRLLDRCNREARE